MVWLFHYTWFGTPTSILKCFVFGRIVVFGEFWQISYANHNTVEVEREDFRLEPPNTTDRWLRNAFS